MIECEVCNTNQNINRQVCGCKKACDKCLEKYYNYVKNNGSSEIRCMSCRVIIEIIHVPRKLLTQECPSCTVTTEHIGGCYHMKCTLCLQDWCWKCGNKMYFFPIEYIGLKCLICSDIVMFHKFIHISLMLIFLLSEYSIILLLIILLNFILLMFPFLMIEAIVVVQTFFELINQIT